VIHNEVINFITKIRNLEFESVPQFCRCDKARVSKTFSH